MTSAFQIAPPDLPKSRIPNKNRLLCIDSQNNTKYIPNIVIHTPDHPPLTDRESHLFATYLSLRLDLFKLAESEHLSPQELLAFTLSPAVRFHLDAYRTFAEESFQARAVKLRASALELLHEVAQFSNNPNEKRRATTSLVARLSEACAKPKVMRKFSEDHQPPQRPDFQAAEPPRFYAAQNLAPPSDEDNRKNKRPPEDFILEADPPAQTPSPELSNNRVTEIATDCLADALNPHKASTAFAFFAPTARLAGHAKPSTLVDFANILLYHLAPRGPSKSRALTQITETPTEATYKLDLTNSSGYHNRYTFRLARDEPTTPWLITNLNRQDSS